MEYDIESSEDRESKWQISKEVYISPDMYELNLPSTIKFKVNESIVADYDPWTIQIFKRLNDTWFPLNTDYRDGIAITQTYELGYFAVFINLDAEQQGLNYIPYAYDLKPAYPNPFNPITSIRFNVPLESDIDLSVYDMQGRMIKQLISGVYQPGEYEAVWDAGNYSSGVYLVKMSAEEFNKTMKVVLLK